MGTSNLSESAVELLTEEQKAYGDLLLLDSLVDGYGNLTRKTLWSIDAICNSHRFDFLLKVGCFRIWSAVRGEFSLLCLFWEARTNLTAY